MLRRPIWAVVVAVCLVALLAPLLAQAQGDYLDVLIVKVKPEKVADFEAIARKMSDANRQAGDHWVAMETMYGENNVYQFTSVRQNYADADKANDAFMAALNKAYGKDGADKLLRDWNSCIVSSRSELRKRRTDLSRKVPSDPAAYAKFIGDSRVLRTTKVHVKPGHITEFEEMVKENRKAGEENPNTPPLFVSQVYEGGNGTTFYFTTLRTGFGELGNMPSMREYLGEERYKKFLQVSADTIEGTQSVVYRFSPALSNPPQEIMAAAPAFWQPKPAMAHAKPKSKSMAMKAGAEKPKQ